MIAVYDTTHQETVDVGEEHEGLRAEVLPVLESLRVELPEAAFEVGSLLQRAKEGRAYLWDYRDTGTGDFWLWVRDVAGYPRDEAAACLEIAPHSSGNGFDRALASQLGEGGLEKLRWLVRLPGLWERTQEAPGASGTVLVQVGCSAETGEVLEKAVSECSLAEVANWVRGKIGTTGQETCATAVYTQTQVRRARERVEAIRPAVDGHESVHACSKRLV